MILFSELSIRNVYPDHNARARGDRFLQSFAMPSWVTFKWEQVDKELSLHLGMKPSLMGQGNGRIYQTIEDYIVEHYHPEQLSLSVAICNQRAQALSSSWIFCKRS